MAFHNDDARLAELKSRTLGANMPDIALTDGSEVHVTKTGTVGALLVNIRTYDALPATATSRENQYLEDTFRAAIPLLIKVGMFELFKPDEWVSGSNSPGRKSVGKLAQETYAARS